MAGTFSLETPEATLVYDVRGPLPPEAGLPPPMLVGHPMDASGFGTLASHFPDRTVVTYDPRAWVAAPAVTAAPSGHPSRTPRTSTASSRRSVSDRWNCSPPVVER
jgi:hypothetical protein